MASFCSLWAIFLALMALSSSSLASSSPQSAHVPTISAAPSGFADAPLFSPTLSPDIEPLFPTPGGVAHSPKDSSLPTIPSSPSPPNPQFTGTPGSVMAFPPLASMPAASKASSLPLVSISCLALLVIFVMQFHGM